MSPIIDIAAELYHRDEVGSTPSLSASIAHLLCSESPAHARAAHPKLNPDFKRVEKSTFDVGTVVHSLLLENRTVEQAVVIVEADDWRTKAAKEQREEARSNGKVALLAKQVDGVVEMLKASAGWITDLEVSPRPFTNGRPERTLVWEEPNGVLCRARLDWLRNDFTTIDDYKSTSASADPDRWSRTLFTIGADVQTAFYRRGVLALTGELPEMRYIVQETYPPYALCVVSLDPAAHDLAERKVQWAIDRWGTCLERDSWSGYPVDVCYADVPAWEEMRWTDKETREAVA